MGAQCRLIHKFCTRYIGCPLLALCVYQIVLAVPSRLPVTNGPSRKPLVSGVDVRLSKDDMLLCKYDVFPILHAASDGARD